ncbi:MAG: hypothetical protein ACK2UW_09270 [Anaerolineales bacterium]|jgi:hypothetical protein
MSWLDDESEDFELPAYRPLKMPDDLVLQGKDSSSHYLPLQVDSDDRLVLEVASRRYLAKLPQTVPTTSGTLEDDECYIFQAVVTNSNTVAVTLTLTYLTYCIYQGSVPANQNITIDLGLELSSGNVLAGYASSTGLHIMICAHTGFHVVR